MNTDPLQELVRSKDWYEGYKEGFTKGEDSMAEEMNPVLDEFEKRGKETSLKFLRHVYKISNSWNLKEITATDAVAQIHKYLIKKVK